MRLETLDDQGRVLSLTVLEKAVIGIFSTITFTMLAWVTFTTNQTSKDLIGVQKDISYMQKNLNTNDANKFTAAEGLTLTLRVKELEEYHKEKPGR